MQTKNNKLITQKFFIQSVGEQIKREDEQRIVGALTDSGLQQTDNINNSDIIVWCPSKEIQQKNWPEHMQKITNGSVIIVLLETNPIPKKISDEIYDYYNAEFYDSIKEVLKQELLISDVVPKQKKIYKQNNKATNALQKYKRIKNKNYQTIIYQRTQHK